MCTEDLQTGSTVDVRIDITVNNKLVLLKDSKQTGLALKKAAIEQGVDIKEDFILSLELGGGKTRLIGNDQEVEVNSGDRFVAIADDDNS